MVDTGADGRIMLMTSELRIYQGMNIKIGYARKKRIVRRNNPKKLLELNMCVNANTSFAVRSTYGEAYYFIMHQETYKNPNSI